MDDDSFLAAREAFRVGEAKKLEDMARVETGQPYVTVRAAYYDWSATIKIRWDADQFTIAFDDETRDAAFEIGLGVPRDHVAFHAHIRRRRRCWIGSEKNPSRLIPKKRY